jgi:vancomycin permeability regulator SanA
MFVRLILIITILSLACLIIPRVLTGLHALKRTYRVEKVPTRRVALVFGAGLWRDGQPTPVLRDRVAAAAELYFYGKVEKLLMSGDNRFIYHNEPGAMFDYALSLGVPPEAIVLDFAGRSTYDSCYRAKVIFGVTEPILVTQLFHLPRALYTCNALGLNAIGVPADHRKYRGGSLLYWNIRELPATVNALWEVHFSHPLPVLGDREPIFEEEGV